MVQGVSVSRHRARLTTARTSTQTGAADLFLDTPSYNAHGTMADNLWVQVPTVSLAGQNLASRVAASMLLASGAGGSCLAASRVNPTA